MTREELNLKPGQTTKRGVLDLGLRCPHSCRFCYYSWHMLPGGRKPETQFQALRESEFIDLNEAKRRLSFMRSQGRLFVDITGGEPTIYPGICEVVKYASSIGLRPRVITLGQFLLNKKSNGLTLIEQLIDFGLHDLLLSVHSLGDKFNELTGCPGGFDKLKAVMDYLKKIDFNFGVNTVLINQTVPDLPSIANFLLNYPVRVFNAINQNLYYEWKGERITATAIDFSLLKLNLTRCIDTLTTAGVVCNVRYLPFCQLKGYEKHIINRTAVQLDPNEWLNYNVDARFAARENKRYIHNDNTLMPACLDCAMAKICGGVNKRFARYCQPGDLTPYPGRPLADALHFRSAYKLSFTNKYINEWEVTYSKNVFADNGAYFNLMNSDEMKYLIKYKFYSLNIPGFFKYAYIYIKMFSKKEDTFAYFINSLKSLLLGIFNPDRYQQGDLSKDECIT